MSSAKTTAPQTVLYESANGIATITLNRPERLNTMGGDLLDRLLEAVEHAAGDSEVRVVVVTGAGRAFCAGGDLGVMSEGHGNVRANVSHAHNVNRLRASMRISQLLHEMPKVTIAKINGACAGAGLSVACACDLRYAAQSAKFNVAFRNAGLSGDFGGTWTLPRIVGPAKARELYLMSPRFDAHEAERIGLVHKALPDAELSAHVAAAAADLASAAPITLALMKQNLNDGLRTTFGEQLDREAERHVQSALTEDHREAARAYLEKRKPVFKGR
jgi:2-(1,2-epoxy-1,2-dihydrophenyl)acetyl-CoA isomerase